MRRFLCNLMMTSVLYHLVAGCCGHHAHAEPASVDAENSHVSVCCGHSHAEHDQGHQPPSEPPQRPDSDCDRAKCYFVVPRMHDGSESVDKTTVADVACREVAPRIHASAARLAVEAPPPTALASPRLHLVNQVFLI